jgi:hypothetical protein
VRYLFGFYNEIVVMAVLCCEDTKGNRVVHLKVVKMVALLVP